MLKHGIWGNRNKLSLIPFDVRAMLFYLGMCVCVCHGIHCGCQWTANSDGQAWQKVSPISSAPRSVSALIAPTSAPCSTVTHYPASLPTGGIGRHTGEWTHNAHWLWQSVRSSVWAGPHSSSTPQESGKKTKGPESYDPCRLNER